MNKFKEFYYWAHEWPDLPSVLLHLVRIGYTVAPFNRVLASGFPSAIFVATASGEVRFVWDKQAEVTSGLDKLSKSEILALTASDVTTRTQEKDPRDAHIDALESALEQERHRRVVSENTRDFLQRQLQDVTSRSRKLKDAKSELTADLDKAIEQRDEARTDANNFLHKIIELQNEQYAKANETSSDIVAKALDRLDSLETMIVEREKQQKAVLELKDRRIDDLEHELNTCKANYSRLLWMDDF